MKKLSKLRGIIRQLAGVKYSYPIVILNGKERDSKPYYKGNEGYWTTPSGKTIVRHPGAYRWKKIYHCSTIVVYVGNRWIQKLIGRSITQEELNRL